MGRSPHSFDSEEGPRAFRPSVSATPRGCPVSNRSHPISRGSSVCASESPRVDVKLRQAPMSPGGQNPIDARSAPQKRVRGATPGRIKPAGRGGCRAPSSSISYADRGPTPRTSPYARSAAWRVKLVDACVESADRAGKVARHHRRRGLDPARPVCDDPRIERAGGRGSRLLFGTCHDLHGRRGPRARGTGLPLPIDPSAGGAAAARGRGARPRRSGPRPSPPGMSGGLPTWTRRSPTRRRTWSSSRRRTTRTPSWRSGRWRRGSTASWTR